jgi:DNA-binding IclR family transcriptional regulator
MKRAITTKDHPSFYNRSLERALKILCAFNAERQSASLIQVSKQVDLPKPTVFRLCSTLTKYDFLKYDRGTRQYSLGLKLFELGGVVFSSLSIRKIASPYLEKLRAKVGRSVFIAILKDDEIVYIDKKEDLRNPIRFASHIGTRRPPYFGMLGQLLMAYLSESEVDRLLKKHPLTLVTKKSITDLKVFKKRLKRIREQGSAERSQNMLHEGFKPYDQSVAETYEKRRWWLGVTFGDLLDRAADMFPCARRNRLYQRLLRREI